MLESSFVFCIPMLASAFHSHIHSVTELAGYVCSGESDSACHCSLDDYFLFSFLTKPDLSLAPLFL
jgi:hypothetical protein